MKLLSFNRNLRPNVGLLNKGEVIDLPESFFAKYKESPPNYLYNMREFFDNFAIAREIALEILGDKTCQATMPENSLKFLPPLKPRKIFCVAVNYTTHAQEAGGSSVEEPYVFTKFPDNAVAHNEQLLMPKCTNQFDHELELALVIGKKGKYIPSEKAFEFIGGYTIFNDVSYRDRRIHSSKRYITNWLHGKNLDHSAPFGPYVVTSDEIPNPHNLQMTFEVNGEIRQNGNTKDMIHKIPELIEYISNGITLMPGDIISTGTVTGSGLGTGNFLKNGDILKASIENLGTLINTVVAEK